MPPTFCLSPPTELQKSILLFLPRVLNPCTLLVQYHDHYKSEGEADTTLHNLISTNLVRAVTESRPFLIVSFPAMHINKFFSKNNGSAMCYRLGTIRLWTRGGGSPDHGRCLTGFEKWQTLSARSCLHGYQQNGQVSQRKFVNFGTPPQYFWSKNFNFSHFMARIFGDFTLKKLLRSI